MKFKKLPLNKLLLSFFIIIAVAAVGYLGYTYFAGQGQLPEPVRKITGLPTGVVSITPTPTPKPTPRPIGTGKQEFGVSMSQDAWPKMTKLIIDPIDPRLLQKQTFSVEVNDTKPITSVTATVKMNDKTKSVQFSLVDGTNLKGRWEGSWMFSGGYDEYYHLILEGVSGTGKSSFEMVIR
ncbi:hypothetical protein A2V61_02070 [Candidatus Woesebacteria bacterium RBG_19FT_COMBO_47_8]|nr:MAG: hypothetical protein A2V61_02070 [Candidatus Woesebacteria bacterium RBG_19FT_COMBO_47_8]